MNKTVGLRLAVAAFAHAARAPLRRKKLSLGHLRHARIFCGRCLTSCWHTIQMFTFTKAAEGGGTRLPAP
jgi:hypothetical protein